MKQFNFWTSVFSSFKNIIQCIVKLLEFRWLFDTCTGLSSLAFKIDWLIMFALFIIVGKVWVGQLL